MKRLLFLMMLIITILSSCGRYSTKQMEAMKPGDTIFVVNCGQILKAVVRENHKKEKVMVIYRQLCVDRSYWTEDIRTYQWISKHD